MIWRFSVSLLWSFCQGIQLWNIVKRWITNNIILHLEICDTILQVSSEYLLYNWHCCRSLQTSYLILPTVQQSGYDVPILPMRKLRSREVNILKVTRSLVESGITSNLSGFKARSIWLHTEGNPHLLLSTWETTAPEWELAPCPVPSRKSHEFLVMDSLPQQADHQIQNNPNLPK